MFVCTGKVITFNVFLGKARLECLSRKQFVCRRWFFADDSKCKRNKRTLNGAVFKNDSTSFFSSEPCFGSINPITISGLEIKSLQANCAIYFPSCLQLNNSTTCMRCYLNMFQLHFFQKRAKKKTRETVKKLTRSGMKQ